MRIMKLLLPAVLPLLFSACAPALTIIHVNDTHSHIDPLRSGKDEGRCGVIERAAIIDSIRLSDGRSNVLLLHAGDFGQGTSYFQELHGDIEIDLINALGYDCITLGNHEFDNDLEELARRLSSINCPVVCCNYDFSTFEVGKYITPYAILHKAGKKIGIVGMLNDIRTSVSRTVSDRIPQFDLVTECNRWAEYLKEEEKCDLVIALSHLGFQKDISLISKSRNFDLVVGGHSHTRLKEIHYATDMDGKTVPIVQDGEWGYEVGVLKVR